MNPRWIIREPRPEDLSFIYSTWLNSFYYDSWAKSIRKSVYFNNYKKVLDRILDSAHISIACDPNDESVIYGYLISESDIAHYIYVKDAFRKFGIAKDLVNNDMNLLNEFQFTHKTRHVLPIVMNKNQYTFNPILLFKQEM